MGGQGRDALTMETNEGQNISFRREKGCFLTTCNIFFLAVIFLVFVVLTGVLVYVYADKPMPSEEYQILQHSNHAEHTKDYKSRGRNIKMDDEKEEMAPKDEAEKKQKVMDVKEKVMDVRLPLNINPLHYYVRLIPFINGNFSIEGRVEMTFEVLEDTKNVTMHINHIVTKNETIKVVSNSDTNQNNIKIMDHLYDIDRQFYIAKLDQTLRKGEEYTIMIDFTGTLSKDMDGFYRSSYEDETGKTRWIAATQFQPTDARKAFPCMDEPGLKASFTIELGREKRMSSISNMPLRESVPMEGHSGWFWDRFQKSVKMSTYLVAFVVSDFKYLNSPDKSRKYDFRVWARESAISQAEYAIKIGPPASQFFEKFFDVPFPLPKQDMIALPDFSAGAMENWGLITYRETAMLYDPKSSKASDKLYLAAVIVHELAHQWFGNLVTPFWWTDLWLNEGFASYMEYIGVNAVEPTWNMKDMIVVMDLQPVFGLDCLESSHPINIPVRHPDEINEIFDRISYLKGSSIIRMMSNFLTEETFRKGLSKYLTGLAYKSAVQDDLWRYLTEQAHADGTLSRNMTVKTVMDTWTLQMGFPVVTVSKQMDGSAIVKQERFLLLEKGSSKDTHDYKWWIPVTFATKSNPDFSQTVPKEWIKPSEATKTIQGFPKDEWVIFNVQETGYYRVNYDEENWQKIIDQLKQNHTVIHVVNRAQLIDDSMALARSGRLPYKTAFKVLSYLSNEAEYIPWKAALGSLGFITRMFTQTGGYGALRSFILSMIIPLYKRLTFNDDMSDPLLDQLMRAQILRTACSLEYKPCVEDALKLYRSWMQNPNNYSLISANLKPIVYCTAIKEGGYEEWKFAWDRYEQSNVASEKRTILRALGCSRETWILNGYIQRSIMEGEGIRKQDTGTVIASVAYTDVGRSVAWEFIKDKWMDIRNYFGSVSFTLSNIIKSCTQSLNTRNQVKELKLFVETQKGNFGSAERAAKQALENAQNNLQWMNKNYENILTWLKQNTEDYSI